MSKRVLWIDTGLAIHLPQTPRIAGRKTARSVHGYFGAVVTREQALASDRVACPRCFPHGFDGILVRLWEIRQEPGARARNRQAFRRVDEVEAVGEKAALELFVNARYVLSGNRQYDGHRFEWRGKRINAAWKPDDGDDKQGREWSVVVVFQNGEEHEFLGKTYVNRHETRFHAWRET